MGELTARLFVALPLPAEIAAALCSICPSDRPGVRPISASDMHITLHFLGTAPVAAVGEALRSVRAHAFEVGLESPGHFRLRGGKTILWVGVAATPRLLALHRLTARALRAVGFEPEQRRYRPHITLARLAGSAPRGLVDAVEAQSIPEPAACFPCDRFALYASETPAEGAHYRVLESFSLQAAR